MPKITVNDNSFEVEEDASFIYEAEDAGVLFGCENGICGSCASKVVFGEENLSELSDAEESFGCDKKHRLICQCRAGKGDVTFKYP